MLGQIQYHEIEIQSYHTAPEPFLIKKKEKKKEVKERGREIGKPFPAKVEDDLRIETDRPRHKRNPSQYVVQHLQRS